MTKTVIITGAASGIGRATAKRFAEEGYQVGVLDKQEEPREGGEPTHELLEDAFFVQADVRDRDSVTAAFEMIQEECDTIDVLVNNAGFAENGSFAEMDAETWHKIIEINLDGIFHCTQEALPLMDDGAIVNISSGVGLHGAPELVAYSTSKFGVIGFTESLGRELDDIRVNAVCPSRTKTAMTGFEGDDPADVAAIIYDVSQTEYTARAIDVTDRL